MRFDGLVSPAVRKRMVEIARDFRKEPQPSEALLWSALRNRQLGGFKFRRQQPIGAFVVDFYCDQAALVVEVDGPVHHFRQEADRQRQELLEGLGLRVLRISADHVDSDIDKVLSRIEQALLANNLPSPSGRGARGEGWTSTRARRGPRVRYGK